MDIYLATGNINKVRELKVMLEEIGVNVHSAEEVGGMPEVEEVEDTLEGNAELKAKGMMGRVPKGSWVLADDSGLFVEALGGRPGVLSARYGGEGDEGNRKKVLEEMKGVPKEKRRAEFVCCFVLMHGDRKVVFNGVVKGKIIWEEKGGRGFGYDPIFIAEGEEKTFAEMDSGAKNLISHRGEAIKQLVSWLKEKEHF